LATVAERAIQLLDHLVPPEPFRVVCHSFPDLDDSIVALLAAKPAVVRVTILAQNVSLAKRRLHALGLPRESIVRKRSGRGIWCYLRSSSSISTHGLFGSLRRGRRKSSSTPWHGELSKQIGVFLGQPRKYFDLAVVSSLQSKILRTAEFGLPPDNVHVVGSPRHSTLLRSPRSARVDALKGEDEKWVLVVPTYRSSTRSRLQIPHALSVEYMEETISRLDEVVTGSGATLWVRPHPLAETFTLPSHIRQATDVELQGFGITLYDMLAATDILVTDYSSIWVDFLALDRPILGFCPDIDDYRGSRGLALEPYDAWFPGPVAVTQEQLCEQARTILAGVDPHRPKRELLRPMIAPQHPNAAEDYWSLLLSS
jgi:CDP-glycerol glycerophosphotransferase